MVVNDQDQHALWQAGLGPPPGWRRASAVLPRSECLAAIDGSWLGRRPPPASAAGAGARRGRRPLRPRSSSPQQAVRRPDATAVIAGRVRVTYRELDASANRLARYLREIGVGPEAVIGVHLDGASRDPRLLAIMKAGGGSCPSTPRSRPSA